MLECIYPTLYTAEQGFELPAEEVVILNEGANYGWPYCYYTACRRSSYWPRNTAATARMLANATSSSHQLRPFLLTGRPTISKFTKGRSFRRRTKEAPSLPSMARGIVHRDHKADTTSFSNRYQTAKPPAFIVFADGFAGPKKSLGVPLIVHRVLP